MGRPTERVEQVTAEHDRLIEDGLTLEDALRQLQEIVDLPETDARDASGGEAN